MAKHKNSFQDGVKACTLCKEVLPLCSYGIKGNGFTSRCKRCTFKTQRERYKELQESSNEYVLLNNIVDKTCIACGELKTLCCFPKGTTKDGRYNKCKSCILVLKKNRRLNEILHPTAMMPTTKMCISCKNTKDISEFYKDKGMKHGVEGKCKVCKKLYRKTLGDKISLYLKKRYNDDEMFRLSRKYRTRVTMAIKEAGYTKNNKTSEILGCSWDDFKIHIENQFTNGMSWNNYGINGWHIDHIIPLNTANDYTELCSLAKYTNCRPLWAKDNLSRPKDGSDLNTTST